MKVIGIRGLGVIMESDVDKIWCHNFKLENGKCVFRITILWIYGPTIKDVDYHYIIDGLLNCRWNSAYCERDEEGEFVKVEQSTIDIIEEVSDKLEHSNKIDFMCDKGFYINRKEELNELLGRSV